MQAIKKYSTIKDIENVIHVVIQNMQQVKKVYCVACGGSLGAFYPMEYFLDQKAKSFSCSSVSANEFVHAVPMAVNEEALVFVMSLGGATPEVVAAAETAKKCGASVIAIVSDENVLLAQKADSHILFGIETDYVASYSNVFVTLWCGVALLKEIEEYREYESAVAAAESIDTICKRALKNVEKRAAEWGRKNAEASMLYTMASGPSAKVAYTMSICLLMEMEWIDSSSIHSGEFFHGPFEITDKNKSFLVFETTGKTRALDERALSFLEKYADPDNIEVIDAKELGIEILDTSVAEYFNPVLHWLVGLRFAEQLAVFRQHPLFQRRYMGKVQY